MGIPALPVLPGYTYSKLAARDAGACAAVRSAADTIRREMARSYDGMVIVGRELAGVRDRLEHGEWSEWLAAEFGWSEWTARRWINVYDRFGGDRKIFSGLPAAALYALASPDTPEEAVEEVERRIVAGEPVTTAQAKEVVRTEKTKKQRTTGEQSEVGASAVPETGSAAADAPTDLELARAKLVGLGDITRALEAHLKTARSLLRVYTRDDDVRLAGAALPAVIEGLEDAMMILNQQCYPEGLCPTCKGERVTADGECKACRGGGWANRRMLLQVSKAKAKGA
jgi:hypothetical protein